MQFLPIAASAMQVVGAFAQGQQQAAGYKAQAAAFDAQAQQERQRATVAYQQGNANEEAQRRQARQALGNARAAAAEGGGMDGSGADVVAQSATNAELDALNIRYQADLTARGALAQADMDQFSASMARSKASQAKTAAWLNAGSQALSGYGSYLKNGQKVGG